MLDIDGSAGEGGGQILRTALALSLATGRPFTIRRIRANRDRPGLLRQHLTAVAAAGEIGRAQVEGAALGSSEVSFAPSGVRQGSYRFSVGTAGSTTLVLQAVLPPLALAGGPSEIALEGGTHNPFAPPFDFLERTLAPLLSRMGAHVAVALERPGFYTGGGGRLRATIEPAARLAPLELLERGPIASISATARVSRLSRRIAERELAVVGRDLGLGRDRLRAEEVTDAIGPGNVLTVEVVSGAVTEVFTGFGRRGVAAEAVAEGVVREARDYLDSGAPVGPHLADQLLVFLALAGGGRFRTTAPTRHTTTNAEVVKTFLDADVTIEKDTDSTWGVAVRSRTLARTEHEHEDA